MTTVEELVARLSFKVTGTNEAKKFFRALDEAKKSAEKLGKANKFNFGGSTSGLSRMVKDFDRATASARAYRLEIEKAARVRFRGGGAGPGGGRGPGPGGVPGGGGGGMIAALGARGMGVAGPAAIVASGALSLKKFGTLEQAVTELGITAGKTAAEMAPDIEMLRAEAPKLGSTVKDVVTVAQAFAAAGIDYNTALGSSLATTRAAKASYTDLDAAAQVGIVTVQNLGVTVGEMGKAFDIMIAGGKLGKAEFKELSGTMPQLAASGAKAGFKGTAGVRDLVAALEVVRESTPTTAEAGIHLKDLLEKMTDPVTQRYYKKYAKVDLEKEFSDADSKGQPRLDRFLDVTQNYTKGNPFRLAELMHEQQSRDALNALSTKRDKFNEYRKTIDDTAAGTTDRDLARVAVTFNAGVDKFTAAVDRLMGRAGEVGAPAATTALGGLTTAATKADEILEKAFGKGPVAQGRTAEETMRRLREMNGLAPEISGSDFAARFGKSPMSKGGARSMMPGSVNATPGAIGRNSFGLGGGIGSVADNLRMMNQGAKETTNNYETNNTDVGNDYRTQ